MLRIPWSFWKFCSKSEFSKIELKDTVVSLEKITKKFSDKDIMAILEFCPNQYVSSKSTIIISEFRSASVILN